MPSPASPPGAYPAEPPGAYPAETPGAYPAETPEAAERLRDIQAITDAALSRLDARSLLDALLDRVKAILNADTAAILLLDRSSGELVATAASGLEEEVRQGVRIPLGRGFAGRVAAERHPVILDRVDSSTVINPILEERGIRALLGVPLLAGGTVLGVLHIGSLTPRVFTADEAALLQLAADRAAGAVQSLLSRDDRAAAVALQRSLLPSALPAIPGLRMAARYVTGDGAVGGDWYDVFTLPSGEVGVVVGDVAGSGLRAAVVMGRMRSALRAYTLEASDPADALTRLDRKIQHFEPDAMATVLYAVLDPGSGDMAVSSAGHIPPVLAFPGRPAGPADIEVDVPIGVADAAHRRVTILHIPPGGLACFYTDGLVERRDRSLDEGISMLSAAVPASSPEEACVQVMRALIGSEQADDDVAVLILHRTPEAARPDRHARVSPAPAP